MKTDAIATNSRLQALKRIEQIEHMRPGKEKWYAIRDFYFWLHPEHLQVHRDFVQAVKELREGTENKFAASKSGHMRNTMKIPQFIYDALVTMDPDLLPQMDGKLGNAIEIISKKLYNAFPEYRVARLY